MNDKQTPARTLERKSREAAALKANMRRRKEQAKSEKTTELAETEK